MASGGCKYVGPISGREDQPAYDEAGIWLGLRQVGDVTESLVTYAIDNRREARLNAGNSARWREGGVANGDGVWGQVYSIHSSVLVQVE